MVSVWAVVTGACGGIGRELTRRLAAMNVSLLLAGRKQSALDRVKAAVGHPAIDVRTCVVDFDAEGWKNECDKLLVALLEIAPDRLLVFSNAGYGLFEPYERTTMDEKTLFMRCNVSHHVYFVETLLASALRDKLIYMCFTSSIAAITPIPYFGLYHVAKEFLRAYSLGLEAEENARWHERTAANGTKAPVEQLVALARSEDVEDATLRIHFQRVMPYIVQNTSFYDTPTVKRAMKRLFYVLLWLSFLNTTPSAVVDVMLDPTKSPIVGGGGRIWAGVYRSLACLADLSAFHGLYRRSVVFSETQE